MTSVSELMYPIERRIFNESGKLMWCDFLFSDALYLHTVLFATSLIRDVSAGRKNSVVTYSHMRKSITMLNQRLSDESLALMDSTMGVVIILAMMADLHGDQKATLAHGEGLQKMVKLRGGLLKFHSNRELQTKIYR
jgi:hypothetical protein